MALIENEGRKRSEDAGKFLAKLSREHQGNWIAILKTGDVVTGSSAESVYAEANKRTTKIDALFYAARKGELLLR